MVDNRSSRRGFLQGTVALTALLAGGCSSSKEQPKTAFEDSVATFFQDNYQVMTKDEIKEVLARVERRVKREYGVDIKCENTPPVADVAFGYALNLSKCKGTRRCVEACVSENNCGRNHSLENIRVLAMPHGTMDLNKSDHYYDHEQVPNSNDWYLPIQCHQCDEPACVQACPVEATWKEKDGIVVIDYDWCIGCRYCSVACPYWARHFNWSKPNLQPDEINPKTHYLGNRPREAGVMEKCTFCIQKTRKGELPACQEACPTGARVFGNLLDPQSEIRYILENKNVFRLKEEQGTQPNFWYFYDV
ncbi:MAG: 4Fe-4S dicluster domain-containing protein [Magnetococcales bacterium]|nr:4Fe-4S dicluster domain-containing protein [Magnetococcales bacterium]